MRSLGWPDLGKGGALRRRRWGAVYATMVPGGAERLSLPKPPNRGSIGATIGFTHSWVNAQAERRD
jgi:hypothetical protein